MNDPKLKQITTESLLESLNNKADTKPIEINFTNHVLQFIKDINIEAGEDPVQRHLLYKYFKRFYNNDISVITFHNIMKDVLPGNSNVYYIKNIKNNVTLYLLYKLDNERKKPIGRHYRMYIKFIDKFNIKAGTNRYAIDFLYNLYRMYMKGINKRPMIQKTFATLTYKTFKYAGTDTNRRYALLNKINLNKHELEKVNQMIAEYEKTKKDQKGS